MEKITNKQIVDAIYDSLKDKSGDELKKAIANVVDFLQKNKFASKYHLEESGPIQVLVRTNSPLPNDSKLRLKAFIEERYKSKDLVIKEVIDTELQGGFVVKVRDEVIDFSLSRQIKNLQNYLINQI